MPRKISTKGLQKKLEHLQRDLLIKKRGGLCEMNCCRRAVVVDHYFSRRVRQLFFDETNLTALCQQCHTKKTFNGAFSLDVACHIQIREGFEAFERIHRTAREHKPFPEWNKRWWLENKMKELNDNSV